MKNKGFHFTVAFLLALVAGCLSTQTDSNQDGAMLRPMSEILVEDPVFADVRPRSVTVLIDTSIPVVCAAVYGPTGLSPDTQYHVRFQGVGPDGTLYRSQDYTFKTPPDEGAGPQKQEDMNYALISNGGRVVGVSSNFGAGDLDSAFGGNKAIDGDPVTEWSSNGDGDNAYIEVELARKTNVKTIGFWTRTMGSTAQIRSFNIRTETDEVHGPFSVESAGGIQYYETNFQARRLRFQVKSSSGGNTGAVEIEVYGEPAE